MALRRSGGLSFVSRGCINTFSRSLSYSRSFPPPHAALQQCFRRAYSDAPSATLSPTPRPKKRFRFLRWTWRLTWLSALGFVGWLTYTVWDLRNPNEQFEPDPSKKTLVILGEHTVHQIDTAFANHWKALVGAQCLY
jgi:NADH:ubiquinone reductase (non-electrogenic)